MNSCYILPDVQAKEPTIQIGLNRVGVTNVKKLVTFFDGNRFISLYPIFNLFVDLPPTRKGANLSRNFEVLDSVIQKCFENKDYKIEMLCSDIAVQLLEKHEYATTAYVNMKSEYVFQNFSPSSKIVNQKFVDLFFDSVAKKINESTTVISRSIGAEVVGMTACPCAQSMMHESAMHQLSNLGISNSIIQKFLNKVPMATHNQRGRGYLSITTTDEKTDINIETIVKIIEDSMSSNIYEVLKRADEKTVVEKAHNNPKFVEDCVRSMASKILSIFPNLSDDSSVLIKQINEESIHKHNACAEIFSTIGTLKKEIKYL